MPNRLRTFIESVVFAGLRPGQAKAPTKRMRWLGPLSGPVQRYLDGGSKPLDPLYLTNRSVGQRVGAALLIVVPVLLVGGAITWSLTQKPPTKPEAELSRTELAQKILPNLSKDLQVRTNTDVQVVEVRVYAGSPPSLAGTVRNNTDRRFSSAELVFDLTDSRGSQVGAVSTTVQNLAPQATAKFSFAIKQENAKFVLVREVHPE